MVILVESLGSYSYIHIIFFLSGDKHMALLIQQFEDKHALCKFSSFLKNNQIIFLTGILQSA